MTLKQLLHWVGAARRPAAVLPALALPSGPRVASRVMPGQPRPPRQLSLDLRSTEGKPLPLHRSPPHRNAALAASAVGGMPHHDFDG